MLSSFAESACCIGFVLFRWSPQCAHQIQEQRSSETLTQPIIPAAGRGPCARSVFARAGPLPSKLLLAFRVQARHPVEGRDLPSLYVRPVVLDAHTRLVLRRLRLLCHQPGRVHRNACSTSRVSAANPSCCQPGAAGEASHLAGWCSQPGEPDRPSTSGCSARS